MHSKDELANCSILSNHLNIYIYIFFSHTVLEVSIFKLEKETFLHTLFHKLSSRKQNNSFHIGSNKLYYIVCFNV